MPRETICKTVHQYNREALPEEDMRKLQEIAEDCRQVKNYVYTRYGGVGSLSKLYPGYTIQNEMTKSGLRERLNLPSVYFYLAIFDAMGDIRCQWSRTKGKIQELVGKNEGFTQEEKHYLRFLLKVGNAFEAVLCEKPVKLPKQMQESYEELSARIDREKMDRYLRRQVRKCHVKQHTRTASGFALSEKAYRYGEQGIYVATKEKRKRIFIPLTDHNQYKRQIYIKLYPDKRGIEIKVPVDVAVRYHEDYTSQVGISTGFFTMLTTDQGNSYGGELGTYQTDYVEWVKEQNRSYSRNRDSNPGRKKYNAKKRRLTERLHSYINHELNRFLQTEKPRVVYMARLPKPRAGGFDKKINHSISQWQRGYIRKQLALKCREQSVELVEVMGKGISIECSRCGAVGKKTEGYFTCPVCGFYSEEKTNTALNVKKRGQSGETLYRS